MKKAKKYNIIIYSTLSLGILFLVIGGVQFFKNPEESYSAKVEETKRVIEEEPAEMVDVDKASIIHNYLNQLLEETINDDLISYDSIKTWLNFRVGEIEFQRTIAFNYFEYKVDIIIQNNEAILPVEKNLELSNEELQVITLLVDLYKTDEIIVKNIDPYK